MHLIKSDKSTHVAWCDGSISLFAQIRRSTTINDMLIIIVMCIQGFAGHLSRRKRQIDEATPTYSAPQKVGEKKRL